MRSIGIDLVPINRFKKVKKANYQQWSRTFTAKEVAMKALGKAGVAEFQKGEIWHLKTGQPNLNYKEKNNSSAKYKTQLKMV